MFVFKFKFKFGSESRLKIGSGCMYVSACLSVCLSVFHLAFIARVITEWTNSKHKWTTTTNNNNTSLFLLGINHANLIQNYLQPISYQVNCLSVCEAVGKSRQDLKRDPPSPAVLWIVNARKKNPDRKIINFICHRS